MQDKTRPVFACVRAGEDAVHPESGHYPLCHECFGAYNNSGSPMEHVSDPDGIAPALLPCEGCGAPPYREGAVRYVMGVQLDQNGLDSVFIERIRYPMLVLDVSGRPLTLYDGTDLNRWANERFSRWRLGVL